MENERLTRENLGDYCISYGPRLRLVAREKGLSPEEAEDTVQDVFLRMASKLDKSPNYHDSSKGSPYTLLYSCVRNAAIDVFRKKRKDTFNFSSIYDEEDRNYEPLSEDLDDFEKVEDLGDLVGSIFSYVDTLSESKKIIFYERISGKTYSEISKDMGIQEPNIRYHFMNIRRDLEHRLRDRLENVVPTKTRKVSS